ncbi:PilN domain-containing protein [Thermospira aquatica]|uniref:PilN domain-containing protein n=1 Tax=Thermospira aquatica TaxID=2828656 RepID=A0AAX3BAK9_9SPIR|nr:PilN domain-containing protein [Thermospira aquatica]URA09298.1 PilN domain-containing protein [Thermospira aquatica]
MDIRALWHSLLERLHLLYTVVDIGEELRVLEVIKVGPWKKVIHTHMESLYDDQRLLFSIQRFLEKYATYPVRRVLFLISRISVISQFLPLPDIPQDKLGQVVEWQLSKLFHFSAQDVVVGYQVVSRTHFSGSPGWNVLSAVMKKSELRQYYELFEQAHLLPYGIIYGGHLCLLPYVPDRSDQAEGLVVWKGHRLFMVIVERGEIVQYQQQLLPENRHLPTELKSITQFFTEYIKLGGGYLVKIHVRALSREEEEFFVEGILETINILAEGVEGKRFFTQSNLVPEYWDMYAAFSPWFSKMKVAFSLPPKGERRILWDGLVNWGRAICALIILAGLVWSPVFWYTQTEYKLYREAERVLSTGEVVRDADLEKRVEEVRQLQILRQYQEEKEKYEKLLIEAQNIGIESSNLKMAIVALAQALPSDVRLVKFSVQKGKGEIIGEAKSSKGLQSFVQQMIQSPYLMKIALAEVKRRDAGTIITFRILFEVSL